MSIGTGVQVALLTYKRGALSPSGRGLVSPVLLADWESYDHRLFRYFHQDLYYFNTVFSELESYATQHLRTDGLYKYTRGIFNPVFRLVNITAAKCYGGPLDLENMDSGAVPVEGLDARTEAALRQLWIWSNFGAMKMRYARATARHGDGVIKIVDDPMSGRVRLEVLHPGIIREAEIDAIGHVKAVVIEYEREDPLAPTETCTYRETIDQETFATYRVKHGEAALYAWAEGPNGDGQAEWANEYGFVPLVLAQAADIGRQWGAVTWHGGTIHKIDQVNDVAALVNDHLRQAVDAMYYIAGASGMGDVESDTSASDDAEEENDLQRSQIKVLFGPEGSQPHALVANVDFTGALQSIQNMLTEIEQDCPELAFARLREYQQHSAPAVRATLGDAVDRLTEFNTNLDTPLLRAFQMAMTIGGVRGYTHFEPFGLDDYARGNMEFRVLSRPIIEDTLTKRDYLDLLLQSQAPPALVWQELGLSEMEIAQAQAALLNRERSVAGEVARALAAAGEPAP